ncbi:mandelate racemase/muconate lactonizing enzyme family protein [Dactylosporangium matsuzakiense]|uniref:Enolase n=1 Tax=Dactylosporangium matsuzakiense TaxID=53360 RepID=A0A9W6NQL6_9ACTN|nr:mandelate racemase/muconate lactonizing enzyme family protein [Dactylosporangium matsuzakiense]UWZ48359.1 mandelate racemase/muconate lactonizing enzyme family protein [Dactylosporangium matsuzakiense]GLL05488.1 enolase [Dactylosporangium matsuzakiense]
MKIVDVRTYPVKLRGPDVYLGAATRAAPADEHAYYVRPPWRSLYSDRYETLLVRLTCDDGTVGWGEALAPVAPEVPAAIVDRLLSPALLGADPTRVRPLWATLTGLMRERGHLVGHQADALAAVDIALWDLAGKAAGQPVHALLGGAFRDAVPTYVSGLPVAGDTARAALAREWAAQGVTSVKLHLGHGVRADLDTFDAVAATGLRVAVDAHWAYDLADALRLGRALDERGAWFLEAPMVPEDVEGHRELAAALVTPVAIGETLRNRYEFHHWLRARALDLAQPDVGRTGITEAMAIAELAAAHHVPVAPHHSVGLGVVLAAGLHVAAAIEHMPVFEFQPGPFPVANAVLTRPLPGGPGAFPVPSAPGLGVDVDLASLEESL